MNMMIHKIILIHLKYMCNNDYYMVNNKLQHIKENLIPNKS